MTMLLLLLIRLFIISYLFIYIFKQIPVELNFSLTKSPVNLVENVLIVRLFCHNKQQVHLMRASSS